jgi:hypothetical protein
MKTIEDLNELRITLVCIKEIRERSNRLQKIYERRCNEGLTALQEKRMHSLQGEVENLAERIGFKAYHQTDPRGASVYLIPVGMVNPDRFYTNGMAMY